MLIGEVAQRSGVTARMLRHYDGLGLVTASGRTSGGYRDYSDGDLQRLFQVEALRSLGMSLGQIRVALRGSGAEPTRLIADLVEQTRRRMERETELLQRLQQIDETGPADWMAVLRTIRLLRYLGSEQPALRQRAALAVDVRVPPGVLVDAYLDESDPNTAGTLRWALAARPEAVEALGARLRTGGAEARRRIVHALAAVQGLESERLLLGALTDRDADVRRRSATALGARGRPEAATVLIGLVARGTGDVEAAELLGSLSADEDVATRVLEAFVRLLDDPASSTEARHRVTQALGELRGPAVEALLRRLATDGAPEIARTARVLLGRLPVRPPG